jgi:rhamnogalacturonan endolyase
VVRSIQLFKKTSANMTEILLNDDFSALETGKFSANVGAHTEYHYLPEAAPKGNWTVAAFRSGEASGEAWQVKQNNGSKVMAQTFTNPLPHTHPMLSTGDDLWRDYSVTVRFTPEIKQGQVGVAFRYQNSRCYYFFGLNESGLVLKWVRHESEFHVPYDVILGSKDVAWETGQTYTATVQVAGKHIRAEIEGLGALEADSGGRGDSLRECQNHG